MGLPLPTNARATETPFPSLGREDPLKEETAPTPVLLPGESQGQRNLVGYSPRGHKESDTTERAFTCLNIWKCDLPLTIILIIILFPQHFPNSPCLFISFSGFNKFLKVFWLELPWIYALIYIKAKSLGRFRLFVTPWTVAHQVSPSMGFSRQEYWSGLPFPSP